LLYDARTPQLPHTRESDVRLLNSTMTIPTRGNTELSELILAALHRAALRSNVPTVVLEIATAEVIDTLRRRKSAASNPKHSHSVEGSSNLPTTRRNGGRER
jgi:hypothetical protein